eukprot:3937639-Rhodomonas_salina.1
MQAARRAFPALGALLSDFETGQFLLQRVAAAPTPASISRGAEQWSSPHEEDLQVSEHDPMNDGGAVGSLHASDGAGAGAGAGSWVSVQVVAHLEPSTNELISGIHSFARTASLLQATVLTRARSLSVDVSARLSYRTLAL